MRILILAVGRLRASPESDLIEDYRKRFDALARPLGLKPLTLQEVEEPKGAEGPERMAREADRLTAAIPAGARLVVLDERGKSLPSRGLAQTLGRWRDSGAPACAFVIGGADGLDPTLKQRADLTLGFGAATWPHMLVRVLLAEQLYRAATILAGHPYHRD